MIDEETRQRRINTALVVMLATSILIGSAIGSVIEVPGCCAVEECK